MATEISEAEFVSMFDELRTCAWHVETREFYALDYEAAHFEQWKAWDAAGRPPATAPPSPPEVSWWKPWLDQVAALSAPPPQGRGCSIERVRLFDGTPYQRWLRWADPWHAEAGERIRYMPRSRADLVSLPSQDWWLFDRERLVLMSFDENGRLGTKELVTDAVTVQRHVLMWDRAISLSTLAANLEAA